MRRTLGVLIAAGLVGSALVGGVTVANASGCSNTKTSKLYADAASPDPKGSLLATGTVYYCSQEVMKVSINDERANGRGVYVLVNYRDGSTGQYGDRNGAASPAYSYPISKPVNHIYVCQTEGENRLCGAQLW
jgi:hypothetical protein